VNHCQPRAAEALDQGHRAGLASGTGQASLLQEMCRDRPPDEGQHLAHRGGFGGEQEAQREGHRQHPLADRLPGQDLVHQQRRALDHAPGAAARAETPALAAEGH